MVMAALIVVLIGVVGWQWMGRDTGGGLRSGQGELVVTTRNPGAAVKVDGKEAGTTPATIRLQSGPHTIEVQLGSGEPRVVPVMIKPGVQTAQYVELPDPLPPPKAPAEKTRKR